MKNKENLIKLLVIFTFVFGIIIKLYYINYTDVWERQHDVIGFGADEGHAAYIEYLLNNKTLPDFDPREKWGFFQPPLHHIISAVMISFSTKLGANYGRATENIQYLTCFYMIALMIVLFLLYKMAVKSMGKGDRFTPGLLVALSVVGLHPMFTLLSGSINNDALSLILAATALVLALKWYENPKTVTIVFVALTIGFSMMAKLTGVLIAVPVGILFVMRLIDVIQRTLYKKEESLGSLGHTVIQFLIFAVIVFPIGLWWTIRNIVKWDMPVNYIPPVGEQFPESVTFFQRIFDIRTDTVYCSLINSGAQYDEYNVPLALIKTSLFGEWNFSEISRKLQPFAVMLFVLAVVLVIMSLVATYYMTFSKNSTLKIQYRVALFGTWITYLLAYLGFALGYNNFSAQDFRYGAICIVCEGILLGLFYDSIKSSILKKIILALSMAFGACAFMAYFIIGLRS